MVVHRFDRLSRKLSDIVALLTELREAGIALTVVTEPHLGTSAEHTLVLNIMASMAEFEHDIICGRLADTRAALKRQGLRVAGLVPYGYVSNPLTKQLQIEPVEADHVRLLFQWAAEGKPAREIANLAIRNGWRTKVRISRHDGTKRGGGHWTPRQVLETLANPTYAGLVRDGQHFRPGSHPAIVPVERFEHVRREVNSRRTQSSGRQSSVGRWPLQGVLACGQCHRIMSPSVSWHGNKGYRYYRCRSEAGGRPPCPGMSISGLAIEEFVVEQIDTMSPAEMSPHLHEYAADFLSHWSHLGNRQKMQVLGRVLEKVTYDPTAGHIAFAVRPGAVGHLAGLVNVSPLNGNMAVADQPPPSRRLTGTARRRSV